MNRKINYLARDFNSIKEELIKYSKQYYPELADDFEDSSIGSWFIWCQMLVIHWPTIRTECTRRQTLTVQT